MGALCSKNINLEKEDEYNRLYDDGRVKHGSRFAVIRQSNSAVIPSHESTEKILLDKQSQGQTEPDTVSGNRVSRQGSRRHFHDFYDGIPRVPVGLSQKSRSLKSTQATVNKVSEMSSLLGRAGTIGFEKAVEVLDVLGSSMTDLNAGSGFVSGSSRGTKISILAFEVANTIMIGSRILHSLSEEAMKYLKEVVLPSEGVQSLISEDMAKLLKIVSFDKRQELEMFSSEVVRFGNRCKDPQWHNLDRFFLKQSGDSNPPQQMMENAEEVINQLMALVSTTSELYHELPSLEKFEQDYHFKRGGEGERSLRGELKKEKKLVKSLKKRSLWSRSLEEIIEKLVDVAISVDLKIRDSFKAEGKYKDEELTTPGDRYLRLGPAGLALHYANIILQIDGIVARASLTLNARDSLYQNLPPSIKSTLRSKLQLFTIDEELDVSGIKSEMEKTLQWLVPMASNTVKSHHGFGWVGEWANTGFEPNRSSTCQIELFRIDTLYHADKEKTESLITDQLLWLHHLIQKQREADAQTSTALLTSLRTSSVYVLPLLSQNQSSKRKENAHASSPKPLLTAEDKEILKEAIRGKRCERKSRSEDFDVVSEDLNIDDHERLSKSNGQSPIRQTSDLPNLVLDSGLCSVGFDLEKHRSLDSFDSVLVAG